MSNWNNSATRYYETSVTTASPEQLVVMLYEGAIKYLRQSIAAIEEKNLVGKRQSIDRAVAIVQHLQGTLDMQRGGEISVELDKLYTYMIRGIVNGSVKLQTAPLEEVVKLLTTLLEGWEVVAKERRRERSAPTQGTVHVPQSASLLVQVHG
jgi:flagellar protein FliS